MPKIVENALVIYTDGSLYPKGRRGGYGVIFVHIDEIGDEKVVAEHSPPGIIGTTGNRMELQACIDALKMARDITCFDTVNEVVVRTDSTYVARNYFYALGSWRQSGWKKKTGQPVENAELWKDLAREYRKIFKPVRIEWVKGHGKGHQKDPHNYAADKLAKQSAKSPLSRPQFLSSVRRKISSAKTQRGSVTIAGQTMVIHVIETKWMKIQKIWQYRYEVLSKENPDAGYVDWIYSELRLRDGHFYEITVNDDMANPKILELVREIERGEVEE